MKKLEVDEKVSRIVIDSNHYRTEEEYKTAIANAILLLLDSQYQMKVWTEESGMVFIDYTWDNEEFGTDVVIVEVEDYD